MTERGALPPKLYFRIGEVAGLVGVEPHVLRYWEREFRTIRPSKSAKGQRVYSRRDVESLLRVRELLYGQGFTIAGARRRMRDRDAEGDEQQVAAEPVVGVPEAELEASAPGPVLESVVARVAAPAPVTVPATSTPSAPVAEPPRHLSAHVRSELESLKGEVEKLLADLG